MRSPNFLGVAYTSRALTAAHAELINLYIEVAESKGAKAPAALYTCPGLDLLTTIGAAAITPFTPANPWRWDNPNVTFDNPLYLFDGSGPGTFVAPATGSGPIRGSIMMAGVLYVVSGTGFYSVDPNWNATRLGTVSYFLTPVSLITNGLQIAIFDGASGFVFTPATAVTPALFTKITLPFTGPLSATYQDGFGLVNEVGTNAWWQSNLLDLTTWDALNFSTADAQPDNVIAIKSLKRECWLIKEHDAEIWINAGLPGFSFQRLEGVFIESGIVAPYSLAKAGEQLVWLSKSQEGEGIVVATEGYQLKRISTHFIEKRIQGFADMTDAVGYTYQDEGHLFYVLNFTTDNETWVYDFTASARLGEPAWHRRAAFTEGQWFRHWGNNHCLAYGKHVIGDFQSGNLYAFNLNSSLDNGIQRRWLRSWRALQQPEENPTRFDSLRIDMQTGVDVPSGTNPQCVLRWSDDGGRRWPVTRFAAAGKTGETARRIKFKRLGSTKRNTGLDRTFELSSSDVFGVGLVGAELE